MSRIVRLLDPPEPVKLTARQRAQRKYKQSAKGRAANTRAKARQMAKDGERAKKTARNRLWRARNAMHARVWHRTYMQRYRREQAALQN